jgi:transposase
MKAYSLDLRQKIVDAYDRGDGSQRELASRFGVSLGFIIKLFKQRRETGDLAPKVRTEQTSTKLNAAQLVVLGELVEAQPDATLEELRQQLYQQTQVLISVPTTDRMLRQKLDITVKKKSSSRQKRK